MYGSYGGQYAPETLMVALNELEEAYAAVKDDPSFQEELAFYLKEYANRPSLFYYAKKMSEDLGGAKIYLKREDLNHTGAHKINNVLGQTLIAKRMGKNQNYRRNRSWSAWCCQCDCRCIIRYGM